MITKYKSIYESLDKTISMEFFVKGGSLYIRYNNVEYLLTDFLKLKNPNGQKILDTIFSYIIRRYRNMDVISQGLRAKKPKNVIILDFLIQYFSFDQTPIDILIHNSGKIDINFEKRVM